MSRQSGRGDALEKLVIKLTVDGNIDPDLVESVKHLPLRQRSALIRRFWRLGLRGGNDACAAHQLERERMPALISDDKEAATSRSRSSLDTDLLRRDLNGQSQAGFSAFV